MKALIIAVEVVTDCEIGKKARLIATNSKGSIENLIEFDTSETFFIEAVDTLLSGLDYAVVEPKLRFTEVSDTLTLDEELELEFQSAINHIIAG